MQCLVRQTTAVLTGTAVFLCALSATAQTVERRVLGWTATGKEIVVRLVQRGERMVDGTSKDYYFEATEIWSTSDTKLIQRYQHGEAVGTPPPIWAKAKSGEQAEKYLENVGLAEAVQSASSPTSNHRVVPFSVQKVEAGGEGYECRVRHRLAVFDRVQSRVWVARDETMSASAQTRRDESNCPNVSVKTYWHPDGKQWATLLTSDDDTPQLAVGHVDRLDTYPHADFQPATPSVAVVDPDLSAGWQALSDGAFDEARRAFEEAGTPAASLASALVDAFEGDKKAKNKADAAYRASPKDAWHRALRAAAWVVVGRTKQATREIDAAVKDAAGYDELLRIAALFELVDVNVSNQLAVHALSHETAKEADTTQGWLLLANGLIDTGEFSKAANALDKLEEPPLEARVAKARLHLDRDEAAAADSLVDELLFEQPGLCVAYHLGGRAASARGDNTTARNLFEAASTCDSSLAGAVFLAADFARLAGELDRSRQGFERFLEVAIERRSDPVRTARRRVAKRWVERFSNEGAVVTDATCRRLAGAFLCSGTVLNATDAKVDGVLADVYVGRKKVGEAEVPSIEPGETQPFGVRVQIDSLDDVTVRAGRSEEERRNNATRIR